VDRKATTPPPHQNARTLAEYFRVLKSGDEARWEQAFRNTWHPEAIIQGRTCIELAGLHRALLGNDRVADVHVLRIIDGYELEYIAIVDGKHNGPFRASFKGGRIYRVI